MRGSVRETGSVSSRDFFDPATRWQPGSQKTTTTNKQQKKKNNIRFRRLTTTLLVHHNFFVHFFAVFHGYDVKLPNFTFYGGRKQANPTPAGGGGGVNLHLMK